MQLPHSGQINRASSIFSMLSLSDIPRESAVDYLLTMFAARRYRDVIKAYSLIPENHPYRDIAKFYTGVSYMNLRLLQKAQVALRNARSLPANLNSQRRRLLTEIDDILEREKQGGFDQSQQYSYQSQQFYIPPPPPVPEIPGPLLPGGTPSQSTTKPPPPPAPAASSNFYFKPALTWTQKSVHLDFNGYSEVQTDSQVPGASMALGYKYIGAPRSFGAQPSIDFNATPSYVQNDIKTSSSMLVASPDDPTNYRQVSNTVSGSYYTMTQSYGISGLYPVSDPLDLSAGFKEDQVHSRGASIQIDTTTDNPFVQTTVELGTFKIDGKWESAMIQNKNNPEENRNNSSYKLGVTRNGENSKVFLGYKMQTNSKPLVDLGIKTIQYIDLNWTRNFEDFSLSLIGNKTDQTREPLSANKAIMGQTSYKLEGTYNLSFGVSLVGDAVMYNYTDLVVLNGGTITDGPDESLASGSGKQFVGALKISPFSYVTVSAVYDYTNRSISAGDDAFNKKTLTDNWSKQTVTTLNLGVNYSF
jgi:hypothetical protein